MQTLYNTEHKHSQDVYRSDRSIALRFDYNKTAFTCIDEYYIAIHSQKGTSCSKSVAGLLPCSHQANIRMRSHRLLQLDDNNSSLLQVVNGLDAS